MSFNAPLLDIMFAMKHASGFELLREIPRFADFDDDTAIAVLTEAGRLMTEKIAPLNTVGDQNPARLENDHVVLPPGWKDAYEAYVQGGWLGLPFTHEIGGMGLPMVVNAAVADMMNGANLAFGVGPLLTQGAVEALSVHASEELKVAYLPKMVTGEWAATMNLTEPQAGTDLGLLKTRAEPADDDSYRITGTKIFITYGDHDLTENIIHLVLARLPDAPVGTRGISLFLVPKFLLKPDGTPGRRNDVRCIGLERKLGIHASPTCVMAFGENDGATGFLVGEPHGGLTAMFTMMNNARLLVGIQGVGIAERAGQQALAYAKERRQGRRPGGKQTAAIVEHPDVRRNLAAIRALTAAARAICYATAVALDLAHLGGDEDTRARFGARADLLTPIAKAFSTDAGVEAASIGIQVHGGMGYIEETGAAQTLRDARIGPIYEGTNGVQAIDLVTRKLGGDGGEAARTLIAELRGTATEVMALNAPGFGRMGACLGEAVDELEAATDWLVGALGSDRDKALAGATPYLRLFGLTAGAGFLAQGALAQLKQDDAEPGNRLVLVRFMAENLLPETGSLARAITGGADGLLGYDFS
ncbi:3-methylmercaptopropionyl-CoA dehydrogenase (DmdC) [hydrothermal vent metagenome]|uniref:3-methylmercaptopropionyl-CoA dehydrogenase (DmdC) n=1 Tax=hydrothermal vent metagenome TaxID=652676 RepID=A0A3B0TT88_9ZZZZ